VLDRNGGRRVLQTRFLLNIGHSIRLQTGRSQVSILNPCLVHPRFVFVSERQLRLLLEWVLFRLLEWLR
jgi:hypothetical protein